MWMYVCMCVCEREGKRANISTYKNVQHSVHQYISQSTNDTSG